jgi:hypothetical protein
MPPFPLQEFKKVTKDEKVKLTPTSQIQEEKKMKNTYAPFRTKEKCKKTIPSSPFKS